MQDSIDTQAFLLCLAGGNIAESFTNSAPADIAEIETSLAHSYEFIGIHNAMHHAALTTSGISQRFLSIAASTNQSRTARLRAWATTQCGEIVVNPKFSPRIIDALLATKIQTKSSLSPWSGEFTGTRHSLGPGWYLFPDESTGFITGQVAAPDVQAHDTIWILPAQKKVLYLEAGVPVDRLRRACADFIANLQKRARDLALYLGTAMRKTVIYDWQCEHFGHYVWNVLSAWGTLFETIPPDEMPEILCTAPSKFFGPISEIFAAQSHTATERAINNPGQIYDIVFRESCLLSSIHHNHITNHTADRVIQHSMGLCAPDFAYQLSHLHCTCWPVILLGLRFDNRSWIDQITGFAEIMSRVKNDFPDAAFVIQGLSQGAAMGWTTASMSLEVELQAVQELRQITAEPPYLLSAVGLTVHENVAISHLCDAFVAPIGSGMSLYKWLANKPGVAFSNRFCLDPENPRHWSFTVFDRFRDNMILSIPIPLNAATDMDTNSQHSPSRRNFTLNRQVLYETLRSLLLTLPPRNITAPSQNHTTAPP